MSFLPLDRDILTSTLWVNSDAATKALWIFLLLSADKSGVVRHTRPAIVQGAGLSREDVDRILTEFASPDPDSRTPDNEGRRIAFVDEGILILNYSRYQNKDYSTPRVARYDERNPGRKHRKRQEGNGATEGATEGNGQGQRSATNNNDNDNNTESGSDARARESVGQGKVEKSEPGPTYEPDGETSQTEVIARRLTAGYRDRYEARKNCAWMSHAKHQRDVHLLASWVIAQSKRENGTEENVGKRLLDAYFADEWATSAGWPIGHLAKDPGKYFAPPVPMARREETSPGGGRVVADARQTASSTAALEADAQRIEAEREADPEGYAEAARRAREAITGIAARLAIPPPAQISVQTTSANGDGNAIVIPAAIEAKYRDAQAILKTRQIIKSERKQL